MEIYGLELKKILLSPMLLVLLALCFGFNLLIILPDAYYFSYADYVADASRTTGYRLGTEFDAKTAELEPGETRDYFEEDTTGKTDIFDGYDTAYIAEAYISRLGLSGYAAGAMRDKYAALQSAVDSKAASDESLTLYFASDTVYEHRQLYQNTMGFLLLECAIIAALIMLLSLGYEHICRTTHTVYATKTGRDILRHKMFASLSAGIIAFAVLMGLTLAAYFAFNDYGNIWGSSVSSGFNYITDILADGVRPFVTWQSYTVWSYLLASLGISALLSLCFGLMAFVIGAWMKNSYIGFLVLLIFNAGCIVFAFMFPHKLPSYLAVLTPVWLWMKQPYWFTDGGADILWRNFETIGACASLVLLAGLCVLSAIIFRKRDIV
jgi:hypothetical protein